MISLVTAPFGFWFVTYSLSDYTRSCHFHFPRSLGQNPFIHQLKAKIHTHYPDVQMSRIELTLIQLIENEYLLTNLRVPAYCDDPLRHIVKILSPIPTANEFVRILNKILTLFKQYEAGENCTAVLDSIYSNMEILAKSKNYITVNRGIVLEKNYLTSEIQKKLNEFVDVLGEIAFPVGEHTQFSTFKNAFIETYGYGVEVNLFDIIDVNGFNGLQYVKIADYTTNERDRGIKNIVDKKILFSLQQGKDIALFRKDFLDAPVSETVGFPATSFDINFYVSISECKDEKREHILTLAPNGGAIKAGSMFQRFSNVFNVDEFESYNSLYCDEIDITKNQYAIVDIRETSSAGRLGNLINTQKNYNYYLSLGCDAGNEEGALSLWDISVGITEKGKIYLCSQSLNKRIKVVTDHMVNTDLNSQLLQLLKGISDEYEDKPLTRLFNLYHNKYVFTPRISLEDVVVSPRTWRFEFSNEQLREYYTFKLAFERFAKEYTVDQYVLVYQNDNHLMLNTSKTWSLKLMYSIAKKQDSLKLSELPEGVLTDQIILDFAGGRYVSEFTFSFLQSTASPADVESGGEKQQPSRQLQKEKRIFLPGEDGWLYMKVYGAAIRQNIILTQDLPQLLGLLQIQTFFFLRYADSAPHLRFRFKLPSETKLSDSMETLMQWANTLQQKGLIYKISFDTYERESNRYGGQHIMCYVENFFYYDSLYVVKLLQHFTINNKEDEQKIYINGILSILIGLTNSMKELNSVFMKLQPVNQIDKYFHQSQNTLMQIAEYTIEDRIDLIDKRFEGCMDTYRFRNDCLSTLKDQMNKAEKLSNSKEHILLSLVHMFCNRITSNKELEAKYLQITCNAVYTWNNAQKYWNKR